MDVLGNPIDEKGPIGEKETLPIQENRQNMLIKQHLMNCLKQALKLLT